MSNPNAVSPRVLDIEYIHRVYKDMYGRRLRHIDFASMTDEEISAEAKRISWESTVDRNKSRRDPPARCINKEEDEHILALAEMEEERNPLRSV